MERSATELSKIEGELQEKHVDEGEISEDITALNMQDKGTCKDYRNFCADTLILSSITESYMYNK